MVARSQGGLRRWGREAFQQMQTQGAVGALVASPPSQGGSGGRRLEDAVDAVWPNRGVVARKHEVTEVISQGPENQSSGNSVSRTGSRDVIGRPFSLHARRSNQRGWRSRGR